MYDVAVIGAGVNGCAVSYYLKQNGKQVALFDREAIGAGGSGAAGAFISPKFSKSGELKELMEKAYPFALEFYSKNFPACIKNAPLLHIAKDEDEAKKLIAFKENTTLDIGTPPLQVIQILTASAQECENVYVLKGGVVDAKGVCNQMTEGIDFFNFEVSSLTCKDGYYEIGDIKAKEVILAYGAYEPLVDEPYINLRGIWGHRIDIGTSTRTEVTMHHHVSISKCEEGLMAIGATHDVHYHPQKNKEPYDIEKGRKELLEKANLTIELKDVEILADYTGLRCGSNDYMPLVGKIVESKNSDKEISYYPNLTMINGVGGYGFVMAPYIAKKLCEHIVEGKEIDESIAPVRFYKRYMKRQQGKKR
ncbi:FAD-binding oxidoreductase [Sulfurimonas sp. HSL3-2]|uniref:NAD(P)/FAD-dependent oxidoreductase n=1 Tax=Hydrocurvibacter mobilis TaxID=3131936 RepID=UPI0031F8D845